jgi:hypothetical protein
MKPKNQGQKWNPEHMRMVAQTPKEQTPQIARLLERSEAGVNRLFENYVNPVTGMITKEALANEYIYASVPVQERKRELRVYYGVRSNQKFERLLTQPKPRTCAA